MKKLKLLFLILSTFSLVLLTGFITQNLHAQGLSNEVMPSNTKADTSTISETNEDDSRLFETVRFGRYNTNARNKREIEANSMLQYTPDRDTSFLNVGGAVRYNYVFTNYENGIQSLGTPNRNEWTWDTWRLNVDGLSKGVNFSFEYRFYPAFNSHFIHHGWLGYKFGEHFNLTFGVQQVPFGMQKFVSHSWWFQLPYYVGLEDDYDMGFKLKRATEQWDITFGYYVNAEPRGTSEASFGPFSAARYSYDVITNADKNVSNIERNQFNGRLAYKMPNGEVGLSGQFTEIFNLSTENKGGQASFALHLDYNWNKWNLKTEYIYFNFTDIEDNDGNPIDVVQMGAYGFGTYDVAQEASMYMIGLSYTQPVDFGPISSLTFYNDYSLMQKHGEFSFPGGTDSFVNSQQNVLGVLVTAANRIYTYFDLAMGYNHPWLTDNFGGNSLGSGDAVNFRQPVSVTNPIDQGPGWNYRFNINLGYYF